MPFKCWTDPKYSGFGRDAANRGAGETVGKPLLRACVATHLGAELAALAPMKVCALGKLAYLALLQLYPKLDLKARPTDGRCFEPGAYGLKWPLLYTCLPLPQKVQGRWVREIVHGHLERFFGQSS